MKINKKLLKITILITIIILLAVLLYQIYIHNYKLEYELNNIKNIEINTELKTENLVKSITNGSLINTNQKIDTTKLGKQKITIKIKNKLGKIHPQTITINIVDTTSPTIEGYKEEYKIVENEEINLLEGITASDNSKEEINVTISGNYDTTKSGTYPLKFIATDQSGNLTQIDFTLIVEPQPQTNEQTPTQTPSETSQININQNSPYYIMVNKTQNVVMVYTKENGDYTKLLKTFICSVGTNTPTGVFNTKTGYEWGTVIGGVFARYSTFIYGDILFHSVPYYRYYDPASLEYDEYNKLGTTASAGCVRLTVQDSKWIFDNVPTGTTVYIYESGTLPYGVSKPDFPKIDTNSPNKDWDPTDPDTNNPWK